MNDNRLEEFDCCVLDVLYSEGWKMYTDLDKFCRLLNIFKLKKEFMDNHTITGAFHFGLGSGQLDLLSCLRAQKHTH